MHARVAAFENRNTSRIDELVELVRERQTTGSELPDALGMYLLIDRTTGATLGISLFESEEAIAAAEPVFDRMGEEIPEELRGKRLSVDTFEVAAHEVTEGAAAARVSSYAGEPATIDAGVRHAIEEILPDARAIDGWKGIIMIVDRKTGAARTITLWESTDALTASETQADDLRKRIADVGSQRIVSVERYDVAHSFDRAPRLIGV